jgi:hypothetical protein
MVTTKQEVMSMPATRIEMCDHDGDGVLSIRDDGAPFSGVTLELSNLFGEDVVADLDKQQLLDWCETVATHLRGQGLRPQTSGSAGHKTSLSHRKGEPGVDDLVQTAAS